jgi:hypothetical protein
MSPSVPWGELPCVRLLKEAAGWASSAVSAAHGRQLWEILGAPPPNRSFLASPRPWEEGAVEDMHTLWSLMSHVYYCF